MAALLVLLDLLLALGATLRLTRFVVADDVPGTFWIKEPLHDRKHAAQRKGVPAWRPPSSEPITAEQANQSLVYPEPRWARYLDGLSCPYCISVWMAAAVTVALLLAGGPGDAASWWRYIAGFLTLAYATGHLAARLGDTEE